ncbi:CHAP domain-containing protein [Falsiroseomonas sp.]|uniref:CHAP domain-containing protein n=1 Tax=Falsiroseomonas sp. TaxID=2870721 RepID=UPI00356672F6
MRAALVVLVLLLAGCGGAHAPQTGLSAGEPISCVPYARARSGIAIQGDAWTWWDAAAGRYARSRAPQPGSVLVLNRTARMREGHVAVVSRVVTAREILVDHANWASGAAKGRIATAQRVVDVSAGNDWSLVRVWYPRVGDFGATTYAARGFVHPRLEMAQAR